MKRSIKKGISLIVLVITIIVMIILATAIILSLNNSEIIGKTQKAVLKSDLSVMQEKISIYIAENYEKIDMNKEYSIVDFGITDEKFKEYIYFTTVKAGSMYVKRNAPEDIQEVAEELNMLADGASSNTGKLSLSKTFTNLKIYGNSVQNGKPSSSVPVKIQSVGDRTKNLLDSGKWKTPKTGAGITVQYLENEDCFLLNGTSTAISEKAIIFVNIPIEKGKKYTISNKYISGTIDKTNASGNKYALLYIGHSDTLETYTNWINASLPTEGVNEKTATASSDYITRVWFYISEGVEFNNYKVKIQIEQSDAATEYEPYGYKVPVTMEGKNLFDGNYGEYWEINLRKGEEYTVSIDDTSSKQITLLLYDGNKTRIQAVYINKVVDGRRIATFTIEEDSKYLLFGWASGGTDLVNAQLEKGSTATNYETYVTPTIRTIYLSEPLRKVGNVADYIDLVTREVVRYITAKDETGTLNIEKSFEVLSTPIREKLNINEIDFSNIRNISVNTSVVPSIIEAEY